MSTTFIEVRNFKMRFDGKTIIEDLSFTVERGEIFGFLGANGSGKTTTIRALLGIYTPVAGELLIDGKPFEPRMGSFVGYLPEERGLYRKETVIDTMTYFGQLRGMTPHDARTWSLNYLSRVNLENKANEQIEKLSSGQQQKIQIGVTIIGNPSLLILDEPTKGFDPVNRRFMLDLLQERVKEGTTVLLVTHQMEEVERLCRRILLLKDGRRRLYGLVKEIRRTHRPEMISIEFDGRLEPNNPLYRVISLAKHRSELQPSRGVSYAEVFKALAKQPELEVTKFETQEASLEEIFVEVYKTGKDKKNDYA